MKAFHGTYREFDSLDPQAPSRLSASQFTEGQGIYFALNPEVARQYGHVVYELDLNDDLVWDMRTQQSCKKALEQLTEQLYRKHPEAFSSPISDAILEEMAANIACCDIAVERIPHNLQLYLDNEEKYIANWDAETEESIMESVDTIFDELFYAWIWKDAAAGTIGIVKQIRPGLIFRQNLLCR